MGRLGVDFVDEGASHSTTGDRISMRHKGHQGHKGTNARRHSSFSGAVDDTSNPLAQMRHVEVDQQTELVTAELQIREKLRVVNGKQFLHTFDLDDDAVFDDEVDTVRDRKLDSL